MPVRTLLVDDEPLARGLLRELLADFPALVVTGECATGPEALAALQAAAYDVVFLDVQMPGLDGVQVLRQLRAAGQPLPLVVFVTAYDQYAVQAFTLHAVDYLLKPLDPDRFADCVARLLHQLSQRQGPDADLTALLQAWPAAPGPPPPAAYQDQFLVRLPERSFFVPAAEVLYLEANGNNVALQTAGSRYVLRTARWGRWLSAWTRPPFCASTAPALFIPRTSWTSGTGRTASTCFEWPTASTSRRRAATAPGCSSF